MVSYSQGFDLAIPSVRKDSLCSFSAVANFIHAKVVNATKLTPEMASIPVNLIGCFSTIRDLTALINIPVPDNTNNAAIAIHALRSLSQE